MAYYAKLTATTQLKVGLGKLKGIFASSGSSPTVAVYDTPDGDTNEHDYTNPNKYINTDTNPYTN